MPLTDPNIWRTKEGKEIEISKMATPHLLSTIHMIERNRMNNLLTLAGVPVEPNIVEYYAEWPEQYEALCDEAERRQLIHRGRSHKHDGIVRGCK